ncbi:MAG: hypothetical protein E6G03_12630 [Actinobacteria bacterium]|nr:MAG: hypothetical protein E6G03_12630 [Actinomycetota bacterium]
MRRNTVHRHARALLEHELRRARGRLATLPVERRRAVEEASSRVTAALVDTLLDEARHEPALAQALVSIYGGELAWEPRAVLWVAD